MRPAGGPGWRRRGANRVLVAALALAAVPALPGAVHAQLPGIGIGIEPGLPGVPLPTGFEDHFERMAREPQRYGVAHPWRGTGRRPAAAGPAQAVRTPVEGTLPLLVLPLLFSDSEDVLYDHELLQRHFFDGPAVVGPGTLSQFFAEVSDGRLTVDGTVLPWFRTSLPMIEVTGNAHDPYCAGLCDHARVGEFLVEGLAAADPTVDFGRFDNDGPDGVPNSGDDDGFVDGVTFDFQEVSGSCGGPSIWPHRWVIAGWSGSNYTTDDVRPNGQRVIVADYGVQNVTTCAGDALATVATMTHETHHILGLPDLYHPLGPGAENRRWIVGCFGQMAAGSGWGCGTDRPLFFGPTHLVPWSKDALGWQEFEDVGPDVVDATFELEPVVGRNRALRVPLDDQGREFLVLEYRRREGFDADLPEAGVLVYHQDEQGVIWPQPGETYAVVLEEADGAFDLLRTLNEGGNKGEADDVWGGGRSLSALTTPSTARNDGTASTVTLHAIEVAGGVARVRLSTRRLPTLVAPDALPEAPGLQPYRARVRMAGGALPYTLSAVEGEQGVEVRLEGEELVVSFTPDAPGEVVVPVTVTDALGSAVALDLRITAVDPELDRDALVATVFGEGTGLAAAEEEFLDRAGNANGRLDIGDLRAYLLRNP